MLDVIAIGDVTEDVFIQSDDFHIDCEKGVCQLNMDFSTKIAATQVDKLMGGNAGNFAIGSSRLGLRSALFAEVGDDVTGKIIEKSLKDDKVSRKYFTLKKGGETNYSVVLNKGAERTIIVYHVLRKYKLGNPEKSRVIYLTSAGEGSEAYYKDVLRYKKKHGDKTLLGFNPGTHQMKVGLNKMKPLLKVTDVISINVEEAQFILKEKSRDISKMLKKLHSLGVKIPLITDGPAGSYTYDGEKFYYCPIFDVPILERTGCGDSYTTGFICALASGKPIMEAMKWGTLNSASVIQHVGPQNGLIKKSTLMKILRENPKFTAREFTGKSVTKGTKFPPPKKWMKF